MLNGDAIRLGTVSDVVDKVHGRRNFKIGIADEESSFRWVFSGERDEMSMSIEEVAIGTSLIKKPEVLRFLLPHRPGTPSPAVTDRLRRLTYITAERIGPREVYALEDRQTATVVGPAGENAVSVLHWGREEQVLKSLILPECASTRLRQVEQRMRTFFPGCELQMQQVPQANAVTLGFRTSADTSFLRPIHVGFGLTQVFPIVVAALSANAGDMILVENPEVHLHPAGQALMGQFLANVARSGIQVIVETHSDHVLNGIRRIVKGGAFAPDQVAIHFFRPRSKEGSQVISPQIDAAGNLDCWPDGFFDQFDKDMNYFAGWEA
jgi:predicted ATPase